MGNLLRANFLRLWKSKLFWVCLAVFIAVGVLAAAEEFRFQVSVGADLSVPEVAQYKALLERQFFQYAAYIGILAAALISLFLGTEYSDGAIRNKIAVGHSRTAIYLAGLLTGFAASALCMAGYMLSCLAVGAPLLGWFTKPADLLANAVIGSVVMLAAYCAIFTFVAMNCSKKSTSVVVCLLGVFLLLFAASYIYSRLGEPEFIQGYEMSVNGQLVTTIPEPNPLFLRETERQVYQLFFDLLPAGQAIQYSTLGFTDPVRLMVMALAVTAAFTGAGVLLFRRKDLK